MQFIHAIHLPGPFQRLSEEPPHSDKETDRIMKEHYL